MKAVALSEDEAYELLEKPYNPPVFDASGYTERQFADEWHHVRRELDALLSQFGTNSAYGEADYNLGETLTLSRGIGLEVTSSKLLNRNLIPKTQEFLETLKNKYEIDFSVHTNEGVSHVFVSKDCVRYWCPRKVKARLGL